MGYIVKSNKVMLSLWLVMAMFFSLIPTQAMGKGQKVFANGSDKPEVIIKTGSSENRIEIVTGPALRCNGKDQNAISKVTIYTEKELKPDAVKVYYGKQEYKENDDLSSYLYSDDNLYAKKYPLYREMGSHVVYCVAKDDTGNVIATGSAVVVFSADEKESGNVQAEITKDSIENRIKITTGSALYGSKETKKSLVEKAEYGQNIIEYSKYEDCGYSTDEPIYSDAGTHMVYCRAKNETGTIIATGKTSVVIYPKKLEKENIVPDQSKLTYNGYEKKITAGYSNAEKGDNCTVLLENEDPNTAIKNAGTYKTRIGDVTGQGVQNYCWPAKEEEIEIVVSPLELDIEWPNKEERREKYKDKKVQAPEAIFLNVVDADKQNLPKIIRWSVNGKSVNGVKNVGKYTMKATELDNPNYKLPDDSSTEFVIIPQVKEHEVTWGKKRQKIKFSKLVTCDSKALKNIKISIAKENRKKTKNFLKIKKKSIVVSYTKNKLKMKKIPLTVKLKGKMANEKLDKAFINIKLRSLKSTDLKIKRKKIGNIGYKYRFIYNLEKKVKGATGIEVRMKKGGNKDIYRVFDFYMKGKRKSSKNCFIKFKNSTIKKLGGKITFMIKICYGKNKSKSLSKKV